MSGEKCQLIWQNILLTHPCKSGIKVIDFGSSCHEAEKGKLLKRLCGLDGKLMIQSTRISSPGSTEVQRSSWE